VAHQRGLDTPGILQAAGLSETLLEADVARVPARAYAALWALLADAMDDEFFGMDRHPMRRGSYRLMCHAVLSCQTLGHALQRMLTFLRAVMDDLRGELVVDGSCVRLVLHDTGHRPQRMFAYATWLMLVHGLACWLVGRRLPLLAARFRCPEPAEVHDYRTRFCENASFDAERTEVLLDAGCLDLPVIQDDGSLAAFLREAPANLLVKYRNDASISAQVRRRLRRIEPAGWPDLPALSRGMRLSQATLQRRLKDEGLSYQQLKDDLRRDLAVDLLSYTAESTAEVAARLGFSEPSTFHRAFKKWTGLSPGRFRAGIGQTPQVG
jgi:AraC-like DNA-binding protein